MINLDSDPDEPSPEAMARYLSMRRHTIGMGDHDDGLRHLPVHPGAVNAAGGLQQFMLPPNAMMGLFPNLMPIYNDHNKDRPTSANDQHHKHEPFFLPPADVASRDSHLLKPPQMFFTGGLK